MYTTVCFVHPTGRATRGAGAGALVLTATRVSTVMNFNTGHELD